MASKREDLRRNILRAILTAAEGSFFTLEFIKKNGDLRRMTARLGVRKGLVDPENPQIPTTAHLPEYMVVWDIKAPCRHCKETGSKDGETCPKCDGKGHGAYRNINFDTLQWVKVGRMVLAAQPGIEVPV